MSELYPGQTEVIRTKLIQAELLLQANQEKLAATTDPENRANLLRAIASESGIVGSYRRALAKCGDEADGDREKSIKVRLSDAEYDRLTELSQAAGQTRAEYIRERCGLAP